MLARSGVAIWQCCVLALLADSASRSCCTRSVGVGARRCNEENKEAPDEEAGRGRKWQARDLALRCVLPPQFARALALTEAIKEHHMAKPYVAI